jgi:hypothetical protein
MIAVLIESRRLGSSAWIAIRHTKTIRVRGMEEGDIVVIHLRGPGDVAGVLCFHRSDEMEIPASYTAIMAEHLEVNGKSRVSVDLI